MKSKEMIFLGLNSLSLIGTLSLIALSSLTKNHQKPLIESQEKQRLVDHYTKYLPKPGPFYVELKKVQVILAPQSNHDLQKIEAKQEPNKTHYLNLSLALEVTEHDDIDTIQAFVPLITDQILYIAGKYKLFELNTPQGRYTLSFSITTAANEILASHTSKNKKVLHTYFSDFLLQ